MHWGIHTKTPGKKPPKIPPHVKHVPKPKPAHHDHKVAQKHKAVVKQHGIQALSNADLQRLNTRMQLEQNHHNLVKQAPTKFKTGHAHVKTILAVAGTLSSLHGTVNGPLGKAVKTAVKTKKH